LFSTIGIRSITAVVKNSNLELSSEKTYSTQAQGIFFKDIPHAKTL
jgi:hypothetical protein